MMAASKKKQNKTKKKILPYLEETEQNTTLMGTHLLEVFQAGGLKKEIRREEERKEKAATFIIKK